MDIIENQKRARVLNDALPYLREYNGKVVVVKYGGAAMQNDGLKLAVMSDIVLLSLCGVKIVLVHGGGPEINAMLDKIGKESKFINGLRYTDEETMSIVQAVLCGKVNKDLVGLLQRSGGNAIGICGIDGDTLQAVQTDVQLGLVGSIRSVNTDIITNALNNGLVPVISTVASGFDNDTRVYNVNADMAAAQLATALKASNLILMTDVKGLLRDKDDESTLIPTVALNEVPLLKKQGIITDGMIPKIECCVEAVRRGVGKANIIDGRIEHAILLELLTNEGAGTMVL